MTEQLWNQIDQSALDAFRLSRRLENIADQIWPAGGRRRNEGADTLAAAAPDLLAALKLLLEEVELSGNAEAKDYGWPAALRRAREAIATAEGTAS